MSIDAMPWPRGIILLSKVIESINYENLRSLKIEFRIKNKICKSRIFLNDIIKEREASGN